MGVIQHGMLFKGDMVRALLDGRKTQTRRMLGSQPGGVNQHFLGVVNGCARFTETHLGAGNYTNDIRLPYAIGNRIWVRETWGVGSRPDPVLGCIEGVEYQADTAYLDEHDILPINACIPDDVEADKYEGRWWPSSHMPKWASRLTLVITDVRVQRIQDISEDDARAEGAEAGCLNCGCDEPCGCEKPAPSARDGFAYLWNSIYEADSKGWFDNPWVVALTFTVHHKNILEMANGNA